MILINGGSEQRTARGGLSDIERVQLKVFIWALAANESLSVSVRGGAP